MPRNPSAPQEGEVTVDLSKARELEPCPVGTYLSAITAWKSGVSASGGRKMHWEATVKEPEQFKGRKFFEDFSLDNEVSLGRLLSIMKALGTDEASLKSKTFHVPKEGDVLGAELTLTVGIEQSDTYGDRNRIRRIRPAGAYAEMLAEATA